MKECISISFMIYEDMLEFVCQNLFSLYVENNCCITCRQCYSSQNHTKCFMGHDIHMVSIMAYFVSYQLLVCSSDSRKNAFYFDIKYISVIIYIFELTKDIKNYYKNAYMM